MAEVKIIYLPSGEGGRKQGVDDYLAAGHTVDDLLALATEELRSPPREDEEDHVDVPEVPYRATPVGLVWDRQTQEGPVPSPLTNFTARIVSDVEQDDGAEVERSFELEASLGGQSRRFSVPAQKFATMNWVTEHLGAGAIVYPGFTSKDHARAAIQMLSGEIASRSVYSHTGWREIDGAWFYLHGGGALGDSALSDGTEVRLGESLSPYALPEPSEDEALATEVRQSIDLIGLVPEGLSFPLLCATYRAALGKTDFAIHLAGPTGTGKSELAALFQQHFGPTLDSRSLTSWESTDNALEAKAFALKDFLMVVDDFAPGGTAYDVQRLHRKADRLIRGKGNASGRERLRADLTARAPKPPRALLLSTGEDVPRGQSLRARMLVLDLGPADLDWTRLTRHQDLARDGALARCMAGFVRWLSRDYGATSAVLLEEARALRERASREGQHNRTSDIVAELAVGLRYLLRFAVEVGAATQPEADELWERGWNALLEAGAMQAVHQLASAPATRFLELLRAAVASGRAHIADTDGQKPAQHSRALGWRQVSGSEDYEDWQPRGDKVGWIKDDDLYLEPDAAYRVAQEQARGGDGLSITERTLRKRLNEKGYLVGTDEKRQTLTVRRTVEGVPNRDVLHLRKSTLFNHVAEPDEPDKQAESDTTPPPFESHDEAAAPEPIDTASVKQEERVGERRVCRVPEEGGEPDRDTEEPAASSADSPTLDGSEEYELVETHEHLEALIAALRDADRIALDLETMGLNPRTEHVRLISVATAERVWLVGCFEVDPSALLAVLAEKTLVLHNAAFDLGFLERLGFELGENGRVLDTMLMSQVVGEAHSKKTEKTEAA